MFAKQNNADDARPCAIIRIMAPVKPHGVWMRIPATTNPMWLTDEYAIRDFRSVCRRQIDPVMMIPHKARIINGYVRFLDAGSSITIIRIMP